MPAFSLLNRNTANNLGSITFLRVFLRVISQKTRKKTRKKLAALDHLKIKCIFVNLSNECFSFSINRQVCLKVPGAIKSS